MSRSFWRCPAALVAVGCISASAAAAEAVCAASFPGTAGEVQSVAFGVGDGRHYVAVALPEAQAEGGKLRAQGRVLPSEVFVDPVSRIVVFRVSGPPGQALPLASKVSVEGGVQLQILNGGSGKANGWLKQVNGKMLPLSLLKIEYTVSAPPTGTPLLDAAGAIVAIAYQTSGPKSGYAIPADVVKRVVEDVQGSGKVSRAWIGLKLLPQTTAPEVRGVQNGSPSDRAGIQAGDVLLSVGSRPLADYADAVNAFYFLRPGVPSPVKLKRDGKEISISVTPIERGAE